MNGNSSTALTARTSRRAAIPAHMTRKSRILLVALLIVVAAALWEKPVETHVKSFLLIAQVLPQMPLKPLYALTIAPVHTRLTLSSVHGPIVVDLFRPVPRFGAVQAHTEPALIMAMGVKAKASDKKLLLSFSETFSRLGYVVMWPRLAPLERGISLPESPETFVQSVLYLRRLDIVDAHRISIIGISIGSSLALVAATDPRIRGSVHALGWFGGYYDVFDYLVSLATHTSTFDGTTVAWRPDHEATGHVKELLRNLHAAAIARIFTARTPAQARAILRAAPAGELTYLRAVDPALHLKGFKADVFILHDQGDHFVPYLESAKLNQALPATIARTYLISSLFEHTHPKSGLSLDTLKGAVDLYGLLYAVLSDL